MFGRGREHKWILNGKVPEPCTDLMRWAQWMEDHRTKRHVADTYLADNAVRISTVFLGVDYNFGPHGSPILFESLIFGGAHDESMDRYCTWADAELGHARMVAIATEAIERSNVVAEMLAGVVIAAIRAQASSPKS